MPMQFFQSNEENKTLAQIVLAITVSYVCVTQIPNSSVASLCDSSDTAIDSWN